MNVSDVRTAIRFELCFIPLISGLNPLVLEWQERLKKGDAPLCRIKNGMTDSYTLLAGENAVGVKLRDLEGRQNFDFHLNRGFAHLGEVTATAELDGQYSLFVTVSFFAGAIMELEEVVIGINEKIVDTGKKKGITAPDIGAFCTLLQEKCVLQDGNETYFLILSGAAADDEFTVTEEGEVESDAPHAFSIHGNQVMLPVERRKLGEDREAFFATRVTFKNGQKEEGALRLVHARLRFVDFTTSGEESEIRLLVQAALRVLNEEPGTYLQRWDKYAEAEGKLLLQKARKIGRLQVDRAEKGKFFLKEPVPQALEDGDSLIALSSAPLFLREDISTWAEYQTALDAEKQTVPQGEKKKRPLTYKVVSKDEYSIRVDGDEAPPKDQFLVYGIVGDETQIERRQKARGAIMAGRCANPCLGILIAEGGIPPDITRKTRIPPLSPFVEKKIFHTEPTMRQKEAIDIALNTPDFALIQGPPGTGKTTVIAAILERLNELYEDRGGLRGRVLVSAFQHDAVENLASRLSINDIPAVKFGKRSGDREGGDSMEQVHETWCEEIAGAIKAAHHDLEALQKSIEQRTLQDLFTLYTQSPGKTAALEVLEFILKLSRSVVTDDCVERARSIKRDIREATLPADWNALRVIRSLRTSLAGFPDDGPYRAEEVLITLEANQSPLLQDVAPYLKQAAQWRPGDDLSFLSELPDIKRKLLLAYTPVIHLNRERPRADMVELIADIQKQLERNTAAGSKKAMALATFLNELENNPDGIKYALSEYSMVFTSTVQFAGGTKMAQQKRSAENTQVVFDTVIIDEAARVSPLDLLIPLSQAEKRIILVGDHRQLPQLIEDSIVEEALSGEEEADKATYKAAFEESMFGYLVKRLDALKAHDHIERVITLDAQYRMHPLLGTFVSDQFYRKYSEKEAFRSPRPASEFAHNLPRVTGKAAVWMDVPLSLDGDKRQGTGWIRKAEAERIAAQIREWIDCPEGSDLSFGVISFYRDQVNEIKRLLQSKGINENDERYEKRLRIGTVDSFQGMEFDVVFLSMVRSCKPMKGGKATGVFGFLLSVNRQCVAMSRQKRLLVMVGDAALAQTPIAREAVPAISAFYDLCKKEGALL